MQKLKISAALVAVVIALSGHKIMSQNTERLMLATFAGGCFWCSEADFEAQSGVLGVLSGYTGGLEEDPSYQEVSAGKTGHLEAVQVRYDPSKVGYPALLQVFWQHIDPTDQGGQFADRGSQYATAIFYHDRVQKGQAEASLRQLGARFSKPIATKILPATKFYPAEGYHQDYYLKNAAHYKNYRRNSGRDYYIKTVWGGQPLVLKALDYAAFIKPAAVELKERLSTLQYKVTQQGGTEPPFNNQYWDHTEPGIYLDLVSGEPLFSSRDKYKSGTGWPSFSNPLAAGFIVEHPDVSLGVKRVEVRSRYGDSHLGHLFNDGPTGQRYCINSAALRFLPLAEMTQQGYGAYRDLVAP